MDQHFIHNPHDRFFKEAFSHIEVVRSFVETYLQPRIEFQINLNNLQLYQNDSVDSSLKEAFADLIYKTETVQEKKPVYLLFEHKRTPDPHVDTQIENYEHMLKQNLIRSYSGNYVYIIPIIIYNGERNCNLTYNNKISSSSIYAFSLRSEFFDVSHMPDDQIR
jgi:predicted transposase/invertase (TIGR01784 family)